MSNYTYPSSSSTSNPKKNNSSRLAIYGMTLTGLVGIGQMLYPYWKDSHPNPSVDSTGIKAKVVVPPIEKPVEKKQELVTQLKPVVIPINGKDITFFVYAIGDSLLFGTLMSKSEAEKFMHPDAIVHLQDESEEIHYYERIILKGEQVNYLSYRSHMTDEEIRSVNKRVKDLDFVKAGITKIRLKAQAVHYKEKGETINDIADQYGVSVNAIRRANKWKRTFKINSRIFIPFPGV